MTSKFYTIDEVCEKLRIGKTLFHSLVRNGKISVIKIGRRTLVSEEAINRFVSDITSAQ